MNRQSHPSRHFRCVWGIRRIAGILLSVCVMTNAFGTARADALSSAAASIFGMMGSMAHVMALAMSPGVAYSPYSMPYSSFGLLNQSLWNPYLNSPYSFPSGNLAPLLHGYSGLPRFDSLPQQPWLFGNNNAEIDSAQSSPGNFWLNGFWRAQTGETLRIRGKYFQLASRRGTITGYITSNGELLSLYIPQIRQTLLFQVRLDLNRLTLQDPGGNTQTFLKIGP